MNNRLKKLLVAGTFISILFDCAKANFTCSTDLTDCSCANIVGPIATQALSGTTVNLRCQIPFAVNEEVQWLRGSDALANLQCCPRYSMPSGVENVDYSLTINSLEVSDENTYQCQIDSCATTKKSDPAMLTVYVLPSGPTFSDASSDNFIDVVQNEETTIICTAADGKPKTQLIMYNVTDGGTNFGGAITTVSSGSVSNTSTTQLSYTFTPNEFQNQTLLQCTMRSAAVSLIDGSGIDKLATLYVIGKPATFSTGISNGTKYTIDENKSARITCMATRATTDSQITWMRGNVSVDAETVWTTVNGSYDLSSTINIEGQTTNKGIQYSCVISVPGHSTNYTQTLIFEVTIYSFPLGLVIGCSIGGFILLILIILLIIYCTNKSKKKKKAKREAEYRQRAQELVIANQNAEDQNSVRELEENVVPKETTEVENALKADLGYSTDSSSYKPTDVDSSSEDETESKKSAYPPSGETFSLSSSMVRSERGSPVMMYSDMDNSSTYSSENGEFAIPSPVGFMPVYYTRESGTTMITDV